MEPKYVTWYIGFFRYDDAKNWNRTSLYTERNLLEDYLSKLLYVDKSSLQIKEIQLPE